MLSKTLLKKMEGKVTRGYQKVKLSKFQEKNLETLAKYIEKLDVFLNRKELFDNSFSYYGAIPYGIDAGIKKGEYECFYSYVCRVFIDDNKSPFHLNAFYWLFGKLWSKIDNSPKGAAKRINIFLDKGLPDDWANQMLGIVKLEYKIANNKEFISKEIENINSDLIEKIPSLHYPHHINNGYCWIWCIFFLKTFPDSTLLSTDNHAFVKHGNYYFDSGGYARSWHRLEFFKGKLTFKNRGEPIVYSDLKEFIQDWDIIGKKEVIKEFKKMLKNERDLAKYIEKNGN
jgi:hypothetical protein